MSDKRRILIVDDSALMRKILQHALAATKDMEVVGVASDPFEARDKLVDLKPDLMTLDIDMPKMDGLTFLEKVMTHMPTRVVVLSSLAQSGSQIALKALSLGAVDVIGKPSMQVLQDPVLLNDALIEKIRISASANFSQSYLSQNPHTLLDKYKNIDTTRMIGIASSTGGTEALKVILRQLPEQIPPILIVQHMPAGFTKTYAENLNKMFPFEVKEAEIGEKILPGRVLIAPGDFHMEIRKTGSLFHIHLHQSPPMHSVRPAADYLLSSIAKHAGGNSIGIVLTGMGKDGASGLLEMKRAGCWTMAQSEKTCVVYGMPAAAVQMGAVAELVDLEKMADVLLQKLVKRKSA